MIMPFEICLRNIRLDLTLGGRLLIHLLAFNRWTDTHSSIIPSQGGSGMKCSMHFAPSMSLSIVKYKTLTSRDHLFIALLGNCSKNELSFSK